MCKLSGIICGNNAEMQKRIWDIRMHTYICACTHIRTCNCLHTHTPMCLTCKNSFLLWLFTILNNLPIPLIMFLMGLSNRKRQGYPEWMVYSYALFFSGKFNCPWKMKGYLGMDAKVPPTFLDPFAWTWNRTAEKDKWRLQALANREHQMFKSPQLAS